MSMPFDSKRMGDEDEPLEEPALFRRSCSLSIRSFMIPFFCCGVWLWSSRLGHRIGCLWVCGLDLRMVSRRLGMSRLGRSPCFVLRDNLFVERLFNEGIVSGK